MAVLEFKRRHDHAAGGPMVWQCECGSFAFWLYQTGEAVCQECEHPSDTMSGFWRIPDGEPEDACPGNKGDQNVTDNSLPAERPRCPFCCAVPAFSTILAGGMMITPVTHAWVCPNCKARGPEAETFEEATRMWDLCAKEPKDAS